MLIGDQVSAKILKDVSEKNHSFRCQHLRPLLSAPTDLDEGVPPDEGAHARGGGAEVRVHSVHLRPLPPEAAGQGLQLNLVTVPDVVMHCHKLS